MGKLKLCGKHRLLCGDSSDETQVKRLMGNEKAGMVFTDPPYGMNLDADFSKMPSAVIGSKFEWRNGSGNPEKPGTKLSVSKKYSNIISDNEDFDPTFLLNYFSDCTEIFLFGADYYIQRLPNKTHLLVWDKTGSDSADKSFGSNFELVWSKNKHKKDFIRIRAGIFGPKDDTKARVHPTQKPVGVSEVVFNKWGKDAVNIVDLYGGSGSTLIACEKQNKKCFMAEIEPLYVQVILDRYSKFTGKDPIREDGVSWQDLKSK